MILTMSVRRGNRSFLNLLRADLLSLGAHMTSQHEVIDVTDQCDVQAGDQMFQIWADDIMIEVGEKPSPGTKLKMNIVCSL